MFAAASFADIDDTSSSTHCDTRRKGKVKAKLLHIHICDMAIASDILRLVGGPLALGVYTFLAVQIQNALDPRITRC
jgi:hypothetical protein